MLIDHMADGGTFNGFCGRADIGVQTGFDWIHRHKEFKEAKQIAVSKHMLWAEEQMKRGMWGGKQFNPVVWIFMMKNIHGWRDKLEISEAEEHEAAFSYDK